MLKLVFFLMGFLMVILYSLVDKEYKSIVLIAFISSILFRFLFDYKKKILNK